MAAPGDEGQEEPQDAEDQESDHEWMEMAPEDLLPLFPRQSLARTPLPSSTCCS